MSAERLCVFCRTRPVDAPWRPFCSERCRLLDLRSWVEGAYRVPSTPVSSESDDELDEAGETPGGGSS
jgi:endogenous inhibitor of DNA gyrase (YacG/DUF329 family)